MTEPSRSHGGILLPLDMFRPTMIASLLGEALVAKARNVLGSGMRMTRHPEAQLLLLTIEGPVVDDDPCAFWRENADLGLVLSQVIPAQIFIYFASSSPRRQGFVVAQGGRTVAGDDVSEDMMPPEATDEDWPLARLMPRIGIRMDELEAGFAPGPTIELPLVDVHGDDGELLRTLAGIPEDGVPEDSGPAPAGPPAGPPPAATPSAPAPGAAASSAPAGAGGAPAARPADDVKRRAVERQAERDEREALAQQLRSDLPSSLDDIGLVVAPRAELSDTDLLSPFVVRKVRGDVPEGISRDLTEKLQGLRIDIAVPVEFLSEVFRDDGPLNKPTFEAQAEERDGLKILAVHAPRLGGGTLLRRGRAGVFVSRSPSMPLPMDLVESILSAQEG